MLQSILAKTNQLMKNFIYIPIVALFMAGCKKEKESPVRPDPLIIAEKIAHAHGLDQWQNVSEIAYTFNVDRKNKHFERSWIWKPKSHDVTFISETDTISYNRSKLDSVSIAIDRNFINDKFWLLAPFQLVWDTGTTILKPIKTKTEINHEYLNKITVIYPKNGGYTPGDAYDIFYDDNFLIKEWVYRKGNRAKPSMITTFENHQNFNGITVALEHKKQNGNWNLNFTNVRITK